MTSSRATALSIVIPSNRAGFGAYGRIMSAAAWASDTIETIVRDNSGNAEKRSVLGSLQGPNLRVLLADPCDATTNFLEAGRAARGEFLLFLGDDDSAFDRGVAAIADAAVSHADDRSVVGITGRYVFEGAWGSQIRNYRDVDSTDAGARLGGLLASDGANLIFYSAVRRQVVHDVWATVLAHPFRFPFHDQLCSLLYLLGGRFVSVGRLVYVYDNANWDGTAFLAAELKIYAAAGMDAAIRWLHWIICGFEGASLIMHSRFGARYAADERQAMANAWFAAMYRRFINERIVVESSSLNAAAIALSRRWKDADDPNFSLEALLDDISGFIGMSSTEHAEAYRAYWEGIRSGG